MKLKTGVTAFSAIAIIAIAAVISSGARTQPAVASVSADNELSILTNPGFWSGFDAKSAKGTNSLSSFYRYFHKDWEKKFPNLKITETKASGAETSAKVLLGVRAGNPPDVVALADLGPLVERGALENLDEYYKRAGVDQSLFLPAMANFARRGGHWYAIPAASNPSNGDLLYVPKQVKAAGLDPNNPPRTWNDLYNVSKKVVKFDGKGNLVRVGYQLLYDQGPWSDPVNMYCGRWETFDPKTTKFTANSPCIKAFFTLQKKFVDLYGGIAKYQKFYASDPQVWSCSPKEHLTTGKALFRVDAWWSGNQMDQCPDFKQEWRLAPAPTRTGAPNERKGIRTAAWMVAIPKGAKHPQLAFDFAKLILWDNARKLGPTTNGPVVKNQLEAWTSTLIAASNRSRAQHGASGRPMAAAMKVVLSEAKVGEVALPSDPNAAYFNEVLTGAWQKIAFGRSPVGKALDDAQKQIDSRQGH